ncbi:MAG: hypothetical protein H6698_09475 [Myxococcales bacterium]|nr:hypothetical protein [Myxococcales bacterium]MCB9534511.1 hypothetical protein [Myxococcales bacterium]
MRRRRLDPAARQRRHALGGGLVLLALLMAAPALGAADGSGYDRDALSERGFVAVESGRQESVPGGVFMLAGYIVFVGLLTGYVARLSSKHAAAQAELAALRRAVEDLDDRIAGPRS